MCGIALLLGPPLSEADHRRFEAMAAGISQRGESMEEEREATSLLVTSRLKIVDRDRAQQPWRTGGGRYSLCYNGEVFNHAELRERLEAEGVVFRSTSDTEVVVTKSGKETHGLGIFFLRFTTRHSPACAF